MPRIFISLSVSSMLLLIVTAFIGIFGWGSSSDTHVLLSVITLILSCLIQTLVFTYFTVTCKMSIQAIHIAGMEPFPIEKMKKLKLSMMWLILILFGSILFSVISGALQIRASETGYTHLMAAGIILTLHTFVYIREYSLIDTNSRIVEQVLHGYESWRASKDEDSANARNMQHTI